MDITIPPVIQIIFDEEFWRFTSPQELKAQLVSRGILKELQVQAEWTVDNFVFDDMEESAETGDFVVTPSGSLNPFSRVGKCGAETCRAELADDFIKSVGLYSERAIVPDPITTFFTEEKLLSDRDFNALYNDLKVLHQLKPLIESGVLRLGSPYRKYCEDCYKQVSETVLVASKSLSEAAKRNVEVRYINQNGKATLFIRSPELYPDQNHPLVSIHELTNKEHMEYLRLCHPYGIKKNKNECKEFISRFLTKSISSDLRSIFFELDSSKRTHSLLLAGSRIEPLFLAHLEGQVPSPIEIENWEKLRTINLPWLGKLNAEEVLKLRESAEIALPRLRELLAAKLSKPSEQNTNNASEIIADLKAQVLDVEAELNSLNLMKERKYKIGMIGLSMAFVIYGLASGVPPLQAGSIATLLATLAHIRNAERDLDTKAKVLMSRPAFALLKAKRILKSRG
jgi:hypothetical protein